MLRKLDYFKKLICFRRFLNRIFHKEAIFSSVGNRNIDLYPKILEYYKENNDPWKRTEKKDSNHLNDIKKQKSRKKFFTDFNQRINFLKNFKDCLHKKGNWIFMLYTITILIAFLFWFISGFYTVKETEKGVILRFGKFHCIVYPGLNWRPLFIDTVTTVDVESVRELSTSGIMLTSDENVVQVEMNVQYRISNPKNYLFKVVNPDDSLRQATDSALRGVVGKYSMDKILTEGRTIVRNDTQNILCETIYPYNMGISVLDVNFQIARPPEEVKESFDDAIAARENEQQYIREAEAYANEVQPKAKGQAQRILEEGKAYKIKTILEAEGEVQRFMKILSEYKFSPEITKKRLYIDAMERALRNSQKVLITGKNNLFVFPITSGNFLSDFLDKKSSSLCKKIDPKRNLNNLKFTGHNFLKK